MGIINPVIHSNFKRILLLSTLLVSACAPQPRWGVFATSSMHYPNVEPSKKNVHLGGTKLYTTNSGYFQHNYGRYHKNKFGWIIKKPQGKGVIAYWGVKTPTIEKYYYAQNLPGDEIEITESAKWGEPHLMHVFMSFGPMAISEEALSEKQKETAMYIDTWANDNKMYQWGEPQNFYYSIQRRGINVEKTTIDWRMVEGIEISKQQFGQLGSYCYGSGELKLGQKNEPYCFLNANVIDLTGEQSRYMDNRFFDPDDYKEISYRED